MTKEQTDFLIKIGINPNEDIDVIEDKVADYLELKCFDKEDNITQEGLICESILDYIGEL